MGDTDNRHLADTFSNRKYTIPHYQRGYVWTETQCQDLIEDIEFTIEEDSEHYLGNIVLSETEGEDGMNKHYEIIDGQQRITTLTIIFADIFWYVNNMKSDVEDSERKSLEEVDEETLEKCQKLQDNCKSMFLDSSGSDIYQDNIMLTTAEPQREVYEELITNRPKNRSLDATGYSERKMVEVERELWDWLSGIEKEAKGRWYSKFEDTISRISEVVNTVTGNFNMTEYMVSGDAEAGRIFGVLNDRGKDLNIADRVKSSIVYTSSSIIEEDGEIVKKIHDRFSTVYENILDETGGRDEMNSFMKAHWNIFRGVDTDVDDSNMHREMERGRSHMRNSKSQENIRDWIESYTESLEKISSEYNKITNFDYFDNNSISDKKKKIVNKRYYLLNTAGGYFLPILLSCSFCLSETQELRILSALEELSLKVHQIGKRGTNTLKRTQTQMAYKLYWTYCNGSSSGEYSAKETFHTNKASYKNVEVEEVVDEMVNKAESRARKEELEIDIRTRLRNKDVISGVGLRGWSGCKRDTVRYILFRLDKLDDKYFIFDKGEEKPQIEHIRPESSKKDDASNLVNSIGNMRVLEKNLNKKCQDKPLKNKKKYYEKSKFNLVNPVEDYARTEWHRDDIENRLDDLVSGFFNLYNN